MTRTFDTWPFTSLHSSGHYGAIQKALAVFG